VVAVLSREGGEVGEGVRGGEGVLVVELRPEGCAEEVGWRGVVVVTKGMGWLHQPLVFTSFPQHPTLVVPPFRVAYSLALLAVLASE